MMKIQYFYMKFSKNKCKTMVAWVTLEDVIVNSQYLLRMGYLCHPLPGSGNFMEQSVGRMLDEVVWRIAVGRYPLDII